MDYSPWGCKELDKAEQLNHHIKKNKCSAWCTGKTHRDRVEREVGGGIGMVNTCKPLADSRQCMTETTTIV